MNHWFLCARDVMWFLIAVFPMYGTAKGWSLASDLKMTKEGEGVALIMLAAIVQAVGISLLYTGVIR